MQPESYVLGFAPPSPEISAAYLLSKLSFYTDAADVAADLQNGVNTIVVIDTRSVEHYAGGHVPGAVSFPHKLMTAESTCELSKDVVYVTYCDGIGCNGSTQGAYKLARLGFRVKEMIGGLDFWIRDQHPVAVGEERGQYSRKQAPPDCSC
ncbi:rhodanese-like domain-containing protein [Rahnella perminowiae]|uniref:rhodanese-like domain-containing protein n=1 Tax=Rahnella perminowiae TaxID=2816244 RepID=UPI00224B93B1|nr:rhodanese-like domain-containing protein [Rahnella perminowiae]MCX2945004.1 rhodanese-like domain-containing protein [Rahnella perminowiae]